MLIFFNNSMNAFDILMGRCKPTVEKYEGSFDGGSRGNPGLCGAGANISKDGQEIWSVSEIVATNNTNNYAEYSALILLLNEICNRHISHIKIIGDSQLVIKQLTGLCKVRCENLIELHRSASDLMKTITDVELVHVKRELNKRADQLANQAMDSYQVSSKS